MNGSFSFVPGINYNWITVTKDTGRVMFAMATECSFITAGMSMKESFFTTNSADLESTNYAVVQPFMVSSTTASSMDEANAGTPTEASTMDSMRRVSGMLHSSHILYCSISIYFV